jgi:hypothetical protein
MIDSTIVRAHIIKRPPVAKKGPERSSGAYPKRSDG